MSALLVLNDAAGSLSGPHDALTPDAIVSQFRAAGIVVQPRFAPPRHLLETLQAAVAERPDAIFVGGGDGSVSTAASCLAGTGIALGVLPLGTLNHFAKDLGLPPDWREAIAALAQGTRAAIDVGEVNGRIFINNCSLGSYADAVRKRDALRRERGSGKWWAMTVATLAVFRQLRRMRLRIETASGTLALRTPFVVVANNRYSGHVLDYNLRARLDEGRLWIYTTHAGHRLEVLNLLWQSLRRKIDEVDALEKLDVSEAMITRERGRLPVAIDGELVDLKPPLHFRIRRGALQVIAPSKSHERDRPANVSDVATETPVFPGPSA